jgi:hypothetical protein
MNLRSTCTFLPRFTSVTVSVGTSTASTKLRQAHAFGLGNRIKARIAMTLFSKPE